MMLVPTACILSAVFASDLDLTGGPCGIVCLYGALQWYGVDVELEHLTEYADVGRGSSLTDLQQGARDHGLYSLAIKDATTDLLLRLNRPAILHWKMAQRDQYDHYVLFAGASDDSLLIIDLPQALASMSAE